MFEVWDAAAAGGRGASMGSGRLALPLRSLQHREQHSAELTWQLPGSQADSSAGAGGSSGEPGSGQQEGQREMRLQVAYMLQKQWRFGKASGGQLDSWDAQASTAGGACGRGCVLLSGLFWFRLWVKGLVLGFMV